LNYLKESKYKAVRRSTNKRTYQNFNEVNSGQMMTFRSNINDENGEIGNLKIEDDRGILDPLNIS
jgi:hypothetical protein